MSVFTYSCLVTADYSISRIQKHLAPDRKAKEIEKLRREQEDDAYIKEAKDLGLMPVVFPELFESDPDFQRLADKYSLVPMGAVPNENIYYCNEGYGQVRYKTDRFGFRNNDILWDQKSTVTNILVGDSFVLGACVHQGNTISDFLIANGHSTLNLGAGGNHPLHYAAIAKTFSKVVNPHNLIIFFYPNDNIRLDRQNPVYRYYFTDNNERYVAVRPDGSFELSQEAEFLLREAKELALAKTSSNNKTPIEPGTHFIERAREYLSLSHIRNLVRGLHSKASNEEVYFFATQLAIDTVIRNCSRVGCKPHFVYIPNSQFWHPDPRAGEYKERIRQYLRTEGLNLIDTSSALSTLGESAFAPKGLHLSPAGYSVVAREVADAISSSD